MLVILSTVIVVSQLVRLSDVLVSLGITLQNVFLPFLFILLPFLSYTIPMAFLFAVMLSFSRLSSDGEYVALLASGYSLKRALVPVLLIASVLYGVAAGCSIFLEPWGQKQFTKFFTTKLETELDNVIKFKIQPGVFVDDFLGYVFYVEKISDDRSQFQNVMLAPRDDAKGENFTLFAPIGYLSGSVAQGNLALTLDFGVGYARRPHSQETSVLRFSRAHIDMMRVFRDKIFGSSGVDEDFRGYQPKRLLAYIANLKAHPGLDDKHYYEARYLFHQRIAMPFSVVTFALFGMVCGIFEPRRSKGRAYVNTVLTLVVGYVLMMALRTVALSGKLSAPIAAWIPNLIMLALGSFLIYQKNRLPISESVWAVRNLPVIGSRLAARKPAEPA